MIDKQKFSDFIKVLVKEFSNEKIIFDDTSTNHLDLSKDSLTVKDFSNRVLIDIPIKRNE